VTVYYLSGIAVLLHVRLSTIDILPPPFSEMGEISAPSSTSPENADVLDTPQLTPRGAIGPPHPNLSSPLATSSIIPPVPPGLSETAEVPALEEDLGKQPDNIASGSGNSKHLQPAEL